MPVINTPIDIPYKIPTTKSLRLDVLFKTIAKIRNNIPIGTYLFLFNFIFLASTNYYFPALQSKDLVISSFGVWVQVIHHTLN